MKIIPKTKKDFEWVNWDPKDIERETKNILSEVKKDFDKIKSIPKKERTFENTVYALEVAGGNAKGDGPIFALKYVSPKKSVRQAAKTASEILAKQLVEITHDEDLYHAFKEYSPRKEKLTDEEKLLYKETKKAFEDLGFHLPLDKQKKLKKLRQDLFKLSLDFATNIDSHKDQILCTKEELSGLPENYIQSLSKDPKTKKYIVTLAYPEYGPFMTFADSHKKRKELADKESKRGGRKNLKVLSKMLQKRKEIAELMGFSTYVDYVVEDRIVKNNQTIRKFVLDTLDKMKPAAQLDKKELKTFVKKNFGENVEYYNARYFSQKLKEEKYSFDEKSVKEYFELWRTLEYMLSFFGGLFGVSFKKNETLPAWHKDVVFYDVIEKGKVIGHLGLDLFPRKEKFSHMAFFYLMPGKKKEFRGKDYKAPVGLIVGNFPKGTKRNPSLLSYREIQTLFHEFGHACHGLLTRASFASQSGPETDFDFVETPSQLFENWTEDKKILKEMSSHYKTGESLPDDLLDGLLKSIDFRKASSYYSQLALTYQDNLMHAEKYNKDPLELSAFIDRKFKFKTSPKSLFPAGFGHLQDYAASYYTYIWSLVYAYDIFSRFKKEGVRSRKVGKELREKILSKGGSVDEMKQMKDFLGRKPNNKAFLEALGIK